MPVTLKEAANYTTNVMQRALMEEVMRQAPWLAEMETKWALKWHALPWYKKLWTRVKWWVRSHQPHVRVWFGEERREDDWY